mmetsp:Transcript_10806/g.14316  ORF Transcript_10806/g.14316 Transcript_10806/m.14316 type:complete len:502 (-) Transcript_10806:57-1562(-)
MMAVSNGTGDATGQQDQQQQQREAAFSHAPTLKPGVKSVVSDATTSAASSKIAASAASSSATSDATSSVGAVQGSRLTRDQIEAKVIQSEQDQETMTQMAQLRRQELEEIQRQREQEEMEQGQPQEEELARMPPSPRWAMRSIRQRPSSRETQGPTKDSVSAQSKNCYKFLVVFSVLAVVGVIVAVVTVVLLGRGGGNDDDVGVPPTGAPGEVSVAPTGSPIIPPTDQPTPLPLKVLYAEDGISEISGDRLHEGMIDITFPTNKIEFETFGGSGNANLYVQFGSPPGQTDNDCQSTRSSSNTEICTYNNQENGNRIGRYYYAIVGFPSFSDLSFRIKTDGDPPSTGCGNNINDVGSGEICDGNDLGETCESQGFFGGVLTCESDCSALDTVECTRVLRELSGVTTDTTGSVVLGPGTRYVVFDLFDSPSDSAQLYVKDGSPPSENDFDCNPQNLSGLGTERCAFREVNSFSRTYHYLIRFVVPDGAAVSFKVISDGNNSPQ